jgi:hypothetical protein
VTAELWFSRASNGGVTMQRAVSRTNCIDCKCVIVTFFAKLSLFSLLQGLDRTNVVQQLIARYVLYHQLYLNHLADLNEPIPTELDQLFRAAWTQNANCLSERYTGAAAMKTDPGTLRGKIVDGLTAAER